MHNVCSFSEKLDMYYVVDVIVRYLPNSFIPTNPSKILKGAHKLIIVLQLTVPHMMALRYLSLFRGETNV